VYLLLSRLPLSWLIVFDIYSYTCVAIYVIMLPLWYWCHTDSLNTDLLDPNCMAVHTSNPFCTTVLSALGTHTLHQTQLWPHYLTWEHRSCPSIHLQVDFTKALYVQHRREQVKVYLYHYPEIIQDLTAKTFLQAFCTKRDKTLSMYWWYIEVKHTLAVIFFCVCRLTLSNGLINYFSPNYIM